MELIKEAALNTLLGMGMTFLVLISLSLIITLFGKILNGGFNKPKPEPKKSTPAPASGDEAELMAVISAAVAAYEDSDVSPEIVAVIAAAIAASEQKTFSGIPSAKNFAARRIRKSRKHVA